MEVEEVLAELDRNHTQIPRIALEEAAAHREEIVPRLLGVLEEVARDPQPFVADQDRTIHLYAMYLLAQFREPRAYPLLVKIFSAPGDIPFKLAGDVVTQDLDNILASVSNGDPSGMMALAGNEQVNEYVRAAGLDGLVTLVVCGLRTRDEVMAYFTRLFHELERRPSIVWDGLANACADLCPQEVMKDLRQAYDEDLVDPGSIGWDEVEEALDMGIDAAIAQTGHRARLIASTADAISWWGFFHEGRGERNWPEVGTEPDDFPETVEDDTDGLFPLLERESGIPEPYRRTVPKIGRNEPCPCGSGKKYKKCCGR